MNILVCVASLICAISFAQGTSYYPPPRPRCPRGWKYTTLIKKCYYFSSSRDSWKNAKSTCESRLGGVLAQPLNSQENNFLKREATRLLTKYDDGYWIGGNKCKKGWGWVGPGKTFKRIVWFDWGPYQPQGGGTNCIQMYCRYKFAWDDENCSRSKYYICQKPMIVPPPLPPPPPPCDIGWKPFSSWCFYFSGSTLSWDTAKSKCKSRGGFLAEPRSSSINNYLKGVAASLKRSKGYWFGARRCTSGYGFLWNTNGDPVTWNNWAKGQPDNKYGKEDCAHLWRHCKFEWNDSQCSLSKYYICQKKKRNYG